MSRARPRMVDWNLPTRRSISSAGKPRSVIGASTYLPNRNIAPMKSMTPTRPSVKPAEECEARKEITAYRVAPLNCL